MPKISHSDLAAYLDEALPAETMAAIEIRPRQDPQLAAQLGQIIGAAMLACIRWAIFVPQPA